MKICTNVMFTDASSNEQYFHGICGNVASNASNIVYSHMLNLLLTCCRAMYGSIIKYLILLAILCFATQVSLIVFENHGRYRILVAVAYYLILKDNKG